jgi:hypothetical protein
MRRDESRATTRDSRRTMVGDHQSIEETTTIRATTERQRHDDHHNILLVTLSNSLKESACHQDDEPCPCRLCSEPPCETCSCRSRLVEPPHDELGRPRRQGKLSCTPPCTRHSAKPAAVESTSDAFSSQKTMFVPFFRIACQS